jgi:hypothetical protein
MASRCHFALVILNELHFGLDGFPCEAVFAHREDRKLWLTRNLSEELRPLPCACHRLNIRVILFADVLGECF